MKAERKFTYLKKSETKDERVFNGDDPKENKAFFTALKADEKERIESNKQSIDIFEKTLYKFSEILACEVKSKKDARELEVLVIDRIRALQVFRGKDEFSEKYNDLIHFAESLLSQIETKIIDLPNTEPKEPTPTKQGRPKAVIHEASYYLHNKELLQFLIDNYSNTKPLYFNQLLSVLADIEINQLKPATQKEYNVAFGKALNVKQKQSNFDNYFNTRIIDEIFEPIKATIKTYLEQ